jgi:hypothetical protein
MYYKAYLADERNYSSRKLLCVFVVFGSLSNHKNEDRK